MGRRKKIVLWTERPVESAKDWRMILNGVQRGKCCCDEAKEEELRMEEKRRAE